jgi:hypothetical protein
MRSILATDRHLHSCTVFPLIQTYLYGAKAEQDTLENGEDRTSLYQLTEKRAL